MKAMSEADWKRPYRYLAAVYFALIVVAGSIVVWFQWPFWSQYARAVEPDLLPLVAVLIYAALDLIRIPFFNGSTISLGFPVLLTVLLARANPTILTLVTVAGSALGELVCSYVFNRLRLSQALMRAVLYASHHAVASGAAAIAFVLSYSLNPSSDMGIEQWPAIWAYVLAYGAISMLVLKPHDWWVDHLLSPGEGRLPRVEVISAAVVMTPIPIALTYIYDVAKGPSQLVVYFLPLLFLVLLLLARSFAKAEIENAWSNIRESAREQIGAPPNLAELAQNALDGASHLVKYRWGALYSTKIEGGPFHLRGQKRADGSVETYGLQAREKSAYGTGPSSVEWPDVIETGEGCLGEAMQQDAPLVWFEWSEAAPGNALHVPANTAIMASPMQAEGVVVGLLALARPRRLFARTQRDRAQALTEVLGNTLYSIQHLESKLRNLRDEIEQFGQPGPVTQALNDLVRWKVDVPWLMAAISERTYKTRLRAVLREMVAGQGQASGLALPPDELEEIYKEVQGETPSMPPWSPEILDKLRVVTSGLSFAFSFRYRWPELAQSPDYEELYKVLAQALDARTVPDVVAQGPGIARAIERLRYASLVARDQIIDQLERLQDIVALLREAEEADADTRVAYLGDALQRLQADKEAAENELEDPERFTLVQIVVTWQEVVTNAVYAAREGGARLAMALGSHRALPLEEITVQLRLENRGPGLAVAVVAEIQPSEGYEIGEDGQVELGPLPAGDSRGVDFKIRPQGGRDELHLAFQIAYRDRERREKRELFADRVHLREELAPFTEIDDPYVAGRALSKGSPLFFGREDVFEFIRRNVAGSARGKHVLLLVGERRTGKTSILKQLPERLKDESYVHVFFDCQGLGYAGWAGFFLKLSSTIVQGLKDAGLSIEGLIPDDLRDHPQYVFEEEFLPRVWERIGDRSLLLAVDEFEALETRVREGLLEPVIFDYLRSLMQAQDKIAFIFVGAHRVEELTTDYWSVLFNIAKTKRISFLDRESAVRLITEPVRPYGVVYDDLALAEVLHLTAGHPYFLQLVCDALMEHCNDLRRNYVTIQDVRDVRDEITGQGRTHLLFVWGQSSREEKAVLAALASLLRSQQQVTAAGIVEHLADRIGGLAEHVLFDLVAVSGALERLINRELVKETADEPSTYAFTAGLYSELIARYKPLRKAVPELIGGTP